MPSTALAENTELQAIVAAARRGDNVAWTQLSTRFDRMLRRVVRSYRLSAPDAEDAVQATWVKLYENIDRIRDPSALAGWLAKTAGRESLRLLQRHVREQLTDDPDCGCTTFEPGPDASLMRTEQRVVLGRALATLPDRQRRLLTLIAAEPAAKYEQIATALDMPMGSIGPIRARGLARLKRHSELREFAAAG